MPYLNTDSDLKFDLNLNLQVKLRKFSQEYKNLSKSKDYLDIFAEFDLKIKFKIRVKT